MFDYDRFLATCMRETERGVVALVERAFETVPDDATELPWIGYFPHNRTTQKQVVAQALRCARWFECEAPRWAPPLPLKLDDCHALLNVGSRRHALVAKYGIELRAMWWDYKLARPFEVFCAGVLSSLR